MWFSMKIPWRKSWFEENRVESCFSSDVRAENIHKSCESGLWPLFDGAQQQKSQQSENSSWKLPTKLATFMGTLPPNALETDFLRYTRAKQKTALEKLWKDLAMNLLKITKIFLVATLWWKHASLFNTLSNIFLLIPFYFRSPRVYKKSKSESSIKSFNTRKIYSWRKLSHILNGCRDKSLFCAIFLTSQCRQNVLKVMFFKWCYLREILESSLSSLFMEIYHQKLSFLCI